MERIELLKQLEAICEEFKTIQMKKEEGSKFLKVERYSCELNNGKRISREKIIKGKGDGSAAIILPITTEHKVLLAVEPRVFTEKTVDVGLPAGYIEEGEFPIFAAIRELKEETGYTTPHVRLLGTFYQDQGCSAALNHYFIAFDCKKTDDQKLDESEFIKYVEVDLSDLDFLLHHGYIKGLNSAYAIEKAKTFIKEMK